MKYVLFFIEIVEIVVLPLFFLLAFRLKNLTDTPKMSVRLYNIITAAYASCNTKIGLMALSAIDLVTLLRTNKRYKKL